MTTRSNSGLGTDWLLSGIGWLLVLIGATCLRADEPAAPVRQPIPLAQFLTLESPVTDEVIAWVRSSGESLHDKAAQEVRPAYLILEVPTGVSEFHQVYGLCEMLTSQRLAGVKTIAWVPQTVTGPNALIPLACNEIVMHPDAQLGDIGRGRGLPTAEQAVVQAIIAKHNNIRVNSALAEAMMEPGSTLMLLSVEPRAGEVEKRLVTETEAKRLRDSGATIRDSQTIKEPGTPGVFSGQQARHDDILVARTVASRRELADSYHFSTESLRETARSSRNSASKPTLIVIEGMIEPVLTSFLMRQIDRAVEGGSKMLIFEVNSMGGHLKDSLDLANAIADLEAQGIRTVAYVPKEAISGAAIISLGCDEIYLNPNATIGDAGPIEIAPGGAVERAPEKIVSWLRDQLRTLAGRKKRPGAIAEAMCDKDLDVFEVVHKTNGTVWYMTEPELHAAGDEWTKGALVPESHGNLLLTVNGSRAHDLKLAEPPVKDFDELKDRLGIPAEVMPQRAQRTWVDDLVFQLNAPGIVGLLLFVAAICMYLELHMMTGGFGLVAALCFAVFFWSKVLGGTAGGLEILLFVFGMLSLALEIFVIPGVGIFGVTGVLSIVSSLVLASQTFSLVDQEQNFTEATRTLGTIGISMSAVAIVAMLTSRFLPQIPFLRHMVLTPPGSHGLGDPDQPRLKFDTSILQSMIGRSGVAQTLLRPAGKAEIDGRIVDVQSEGGLIAAGTPIEVVSASGNRIVVREVTA